MAVGVRVLGCNCFCKQSMSRSQRCNLALDCGGDGVLVMERALRSPLPVGLRPEAAVLFAGDSEQTALEKFNSASANSDGTGALGFPQGDGTWQAERNWRLQQAAAVIFNGT